MSAVAVRPTGETAAAGDDASPAGTGTPVTAAGVEAVLAQRVRRFINAHAGDVHVQSVSETGDVRLGFSGACARCPALSATFAVSVLPVLRSVDGVGTVTADGVNMSEAALKRVGLMFGAATSR